MLVSRFVVQQCTPLQRILDDSKGHDAGAVSVRCCSVSGQLKAVQGSTCISVGNFNQQLKGLWFQYDAEITDASVFINQGPLNNGLDLSIRELLKGIYPRARQEGRDYLERWVLSSCPDKGYRAVLNIR